MLQIQTLNKISKLGLDLLDKTLFSVSDNTPSPDAILVRSASLHDIVFNPELKAIGRAGAGVNNIPTEKCTQNNVVVFNTPGANANAVKEIVLGTMFMASRNLLKGSEFSQSLDSLTNDQDIHHHVEDQKSKFKGFELQGKRLGVIGLGSIGMMVANASTALGMDVDGYDPFISVRHAWALSRSVGHCESINKLLAHSDFITVHVSLTADTKGLMNKDAFAKMKKGAILLNFARAEIVDEGDLLDALESGHLGGYVCDFPTKRVMRHPKIIVLPHLGASTREAEDNCAIMIAEQISDYLINGNIVNSVNFPNCTLERIGDARVVIANKNIPNMVGQISAVLASEGLNIVEMVNKSRGDIAYNIVDVTGPISESLIKNITNINGIMFARLIV